MNTDEALGRLVAVAATPGQREALRVLSAQIDRGNTLADAVRTSHAHDDAPAEVVMALLAVERQTDARKATPGRPA